MTGDSQPTRYVHHLDVRDRICFVNEAWLRFAQENEAPELTRPAVMGRPLWDFVRGSETRVLYEAIFASLRRARQEVLLPYHCDSPAVKRSMRMTLRSLARGAIEVESVLLQSQAREPMDVLDPRAPRSERTLNICSVCRRVQSQGTWIPAERAVVQARLFALPAVPRLAERVCPVCRNAGLGQAEPHA